MNDIVNSLFNRLSSYQILAILLPGASLLGYMKFYLSIEIKVDENVWWFLLSSYVTGVILSRIGSVVIEGIMKKFSYIKKYDVQRYLIKRKDDDLVETLLSFANLYRSYCAVFLTLPVVSLLKGFRPDEHCAMYLFYLLLLILFVISFCKQYGYFCDSVDK